MVTNTTKSNLKSVIIHSSDTNIGHDYSLIKDYKSEILYKYIAKYVIAKS